MFTLVEHEKSIRAAQKEFQKYLTLGWSKSERRTVAWRPDSKVLDLHHNGNYWAAFEELSGAPTPRFWNAFGRYKSAGNLQIDLEINIPTTSNSRRIAGFFAVDRRGDNYLFHDGSVGGGKVGVGRQGFLSSIDNVLVPVSDSEGRERLGILVGALRGESFCRRVDEFLTGAINFKDQPERFSKRRLSGRVDYGRYFKEFSGSKKRKATAELEYVTRHGDVIEALRSWRALKAKDGVEWKTPYIDWAIKAGGHVIELYEVKTSCDRQALYTAIGQLLVYENAKSSECKRVLVLPEGDDVPDDIDAALEVLKISILRFKLRASTAEITTLRNA